MSARARVARLLVEADNTPVRVDVYVRRDYADRAKSILARYTTGTDAVKVSGARGSGLAPGALVQVSAFLTPYAAEVFSGTANTMGWAHKVVVGGKTLSLPSQIPAELQHLFGTGRD